MTNKNTLDQSSPIIDTRRARRGRRSVYKYITEAETAAQRRRNCRRRLVDRIAGDLTKEQYMDRLIRVNQAGEYGAKRIYEGQLAVLGKKKIGKVIKEMYEQELVHLDYFNEEIPKRRVRPTLLQPIWHVAGFVLGAATALLGEKAAMACTVAVEEVIDEHYNKQLETLGNDEQELKGKIEQFRKEELEHRDHGIEHGAETATCYPLLSAIIKKCSKTAIWIAERV